jgi:hypothetical protein
VPESRRVAFGHTCSISATARMTRLVNSYDGDRALADLDVTPDTAT